jgi:hypothetical protein
MIDYTFLLPGKNDVPTCFKPMNIAFAAIYLAKAHKKGISSCQLERDLGITQKSA